jgi:hypothetical protein
MLSLCRSLDHKQWRTPSRAAGWRVQDVVAHIGLVCRAIFTHESILLLRSKDIERTNNALVEQRRDWAPVRVLTEYEQWSNRLTRLAGAVSRTPFTNPVGRMSAPPPRASWTVQCYRAKDILTTPTGKVEKFKLVEQLTAKRARLSRPDRLRDG